ncbi:ATP-binding protein [Inhella proteolytica]|uniref:histidine kinase n=1 Tax=Inhella proteolytica TaxID=2795029 RepID=A0A931NDX4_9BURK|nr:ATP-binding protein [Inhella proteolytica]MBH9577082.1 hypothetical protein [Inhella proteolytica]
MRASFRWLPQLLRLGLPLLLALPLGWLAIDWLTVNLAPQRVHAYGQASYQGAMRLFADQLALRPGLPEAELRTRVTALQQRLQGLPLELRPLASLTAEERAVLARGEVVYRAFADEVLHALPHTEQALCLRLPPLPSMADIHLLVFGALALLVLLGVGLLQLRPLLRDARRLRQAAEALGQGALGTRVGRLHHPGLQPVAQCLEVQASRIEQLLGAQRELLHAVAHELRTPLARASFALALQPSAAPAKAAALQQELGQDLDEMGRLLDELLSYSRLDLADASQALQPLALAPLLQAVVAAHPRRFVPQLELPPALQVLGQEPLLRHALLNLLSNADRHARSQVRIQAAPGAQGTVQLRVEDDGPGIPAAERERVFEPLARLDDSRGRETGGTGMGLALVARLARRLQGRAWAEASALGGACLVLELRAALH